MQFFTIDLSDPKSSPRLEKDIIKWAKWFETAERTIARQKIGPVELSCSFIGCGEGDWKGPPPLWEVIAIGCESFEALTNIKYKTRKGERVEIEKDFALMVERVSEVWYASEASLVNPVVKPCLKGMGLLLKSGKGLDHVIRSTLVVPYWLYAEIREIVPDKHCRNDRAYLVDHEGCVQTLEVIGRIKDGRDDDTPKEI